MHKPSSSSPSLFLRPLLLTLAAALALLALPAVAAALPQPVLLGTTGGSGGNGSNPPVPSNLYHVDPATGAATSLGNTGYAITGLAQDPTTGILYGVSTNNSPIAPRTLLTINPANGATTAVGPVGEIIADISFDSQGRLFGWSEESDDLVSIDKVTAEPTVVGVSGLSTYGSGSAFDINDTYWLFGEGEGESPPPNDEGGFHTVDTTTGLPTFRGRLTPVLDENESPVSSAAFDCARTTLYATIQNYGKPPAYLVTIDTATGAVTNKGSAVTATDGLEWYCPLAFEFNSGPIEVAAKNVTLSLPVVRGPRIKGSASVNFATVPGSAQAGRDFVAAAGTLAFANNAADASVPVTIKRDPKAGKNRNFQIALSSPSAGGTVGTPLQVTILAGKPQRATIKGPKTTSAERPVFKLRAKQLPARFRCKLDKGKFKGCGKNGKKGKKYKTPELDPGKHKLVVQVVNGAGKKSKPAKKVFTVLP